MKLKELKKSLGKFGGDFDDCEVLISFKDSFENEDYDLVAGVGHDKNMESVYLISLAMIDKHLKNPINEKWNKSNE